MTLLAIVLVGIGSYAFRVVPLLILPRMTISAKAERSLRHASTAAISGLVVGSLVGARSPEDLGASVLAVATALVVAVRGATLLRIVGSGIAVYVAVLAVETALS